MGASSSLDAAPLAQAMALVLTCCDGPQSTLDTAGVSAERIAELFWWMAGGAVVIWLAVVVLAVYAIHLRPEKHSQRAANRLIIGGGVALPTVVLAVLLVYALSLMPGLETGPESTRFEIEVSGEQWWWRVRYRLPDGESFELANEIRLPVGERVEIVLSSPDVIHSFWVPSIAGKRDMIPGRTTRLVLEPTRTGTFRGACAEYCGESHAWMAFFVVVMEEDGFEAWLEHQRSPGASRDDPIVTRGRELFLESGCGACHTVRGTRADGVVGPDLTHVGSRVSLAAATLENDVSAFEHWIAFSKDVKPGAQMPRFRMLPAEELAALAAYMESLQ
ncbi:MAG TPA: cytochrome c oxidase subunit II [Vicinamibacteria bacterium]|nr:cytochrome c oxidase subunit II [Vicinamibacteria bacterium]